MAMDYLEFELEISSAAPGQYAVAVVASVTPFSDATLNAWLTPAPPGVTDVTFAQLRADAVDRLLDRDRADDPSHRRQQREQQRDTETVTKLG